MTSGNGPHLNMFSILALNPDFQNILTSGLLTKKFFEVAVLPRPQNKSEIATEITLGRQERILFSDSAAPRIYDKDEYFWLIIDYSLAVLPFDMNNNKVLGIRVTQIQGAMMQGKYFYLHI